MRKLLALKANRAGLGIPDPTATVDKLHKALLGCSEWLVELMLTRDKMSPMEHWECVKKGSLEGRKI